MEKEREMGDSRCRLCDQTSTGRWVNKEKYSRDIMMAFSIDVAKDSSLEQLSICHCCRPAPSAFGSQSGTRKRRRQSRRDCGQLNNQRAGDA